MKTFTEVFKTKDGELELTVYLNVNEDENYTKIILYYNNDCIFAKKMHGICTSTKELTENAVYGMINSINGFELDCLPETIVDGKFID